MLKQQSNKDKHVPWNTSLTAAAGKKGQTNKDGAYIDETKRIYIYYRQREREALRATHFHHNTTKIDGLFKI